MRSLPKGAVPASIKSAGHALDVRTSCCLPPCLPQIYCTNEASKKLKDSQDGGMDLQAYIEFRRNFRCGLRAYAHTYICYRSAPARTRAIAPYVRSALWS